MKPSQIALAYGNTFIDLKIPQDTTILKIKEPLIRVSKKRFIQGLDDILPAGPIYGSIAIVVADKTRLCGYEYALEWLMEGLGLRQVKQEQVHFYIAYGTHARQSDEECLHAYGDSYKKYQFIHHDCTTPDLFSTLGTTRKGTLIRVRKDILATDVLITFGAVSHHYFAGYGGGRKLLFPGLGEKQAIYHNHSLFLDRNTRRLSTDCQPGNLDNNPVSDDLYEVHTNLPHYISIHGILTSTGKVATFSFGTSYADFLQVCAELDQYYRVEQRSQYGLVIASGGGFPKDINFIQLHKAIHNSARFVKNGGTLIVAGECKDKVGSTTLLPYFDMGSYEEAFSHLVHNYAGNGGTALALMEKTRRIRIKLLTSLDDGIVQHLGMEKISLAEIQALLTSNRGKHTIALIANGALQI